MHGHKKLAKEDNVVITKVGEFGSWYEKASIKY